MIKNSSLWLAWLIVAVVAAVIEILTPSFGFIFVSGAALIGLLAAAVGMPWFVQVVLFAIVLLLTLLLLRPYLQKKFGSFGKVPSRTDRLLGQRGLITERVDPVRGTGRVSVGGQDWAAKGIEVLEEGTEVIIEGADGIRLLVAAIDP